MRFILALLLMSGTATAQVQNRTYQDSMGRNTGRSVTDSRGNTTYYNSMGRNTGRSATDSRGPRRSMMRWDATPDDPPRTATQRSPPTASVVGQGSSKGAGDGPALASGDGALFKRATVAR